MAHSLSSELFPVFSSCSKYSILPLIRGRSLFEDFLLFAAQTTVSICKFSIISPKFAGPHLIKKIFRPKLSETNFQAWMLASPECIRNNLLKSDFAIPSHKKMAANKRRTIHYPFQQVASFVIWTEWNQSHIRLECNKNVMESIQIFCVRIEDIYTETFKTGIAG